MRRLIPVFVILAAVVLLFFGIKLLIPSKDAAGGPGGGPGGAGGGMPPTAVETVRIARQSLPNRFETVASLRADKAIRLRPEVAGQLRAIRFTEGEPVRQGQVLFALDDALVSADLNEA